MRKTKRSFNALQKDALTREEMNEIKGGKPQQPKVCDKKYNTKKILSDNYKKRVLGLGIFQVILSRFGALLHRFQT